MSMQDKEFSVFVEPYLEHYFSNVEIHGAGEVLYNRLRNSHIFLRARWTLVQTAEHQMDLELESLWTNTD